MPNTALEALARADLTDPHSFNEAVGVVKRYVKGKMQKYKSVSPAMPGGKLEALEKKYAPLGYQDVFYIARLELELPASSLALPRPSDAVYKRLEDAGYPLPDAFADAGPSSPVVARAASIKTTRPGAPSWITEDEFMAGMPMTRETFGLAVQHAKRAQKEAEIIAAATAAAAVAAQASSPVSITSRLPPVPPPPKREPSNSIPIPGPARDTRACCPDHREHYHGPDGAPFSDYKLSLELTRGDSPTLPLSPRHSTMPLSEGGGLMTLANRSSPTLGPTRRLTADIRALFEALPPEAQALAEQRLQEAKQKQMERERAAAAAERRAVSERSKEQQLELDKQLSWERAKAREADAKSRTVDKERRAARRELEKQRLQLIATQQLSSSPDSDSTVAKSATFQGLVDRLPSPPPRMDEDARRMIEARIATLQSALAAMGVEPGTPALPPTPSRSPTLESPRTFRQSSTTSQFSHASAPSPVISTPHSSFSSPPVPQMQRVNLGKAHSPNFASHPFTQAHSPISSSPTSPGDRGDRDARGDGGDGGASRAVSDQFDLDEHFLADESELAYRRTRRSRTIPLTPGAIVNATHASRRTGSRSQESRATPPPSYTLVDRGA